MKAYHFLRRVHLWLSLVSAIPLIVVSVTGTLLVFSNELEAALDPASWTVTPQGAPVSYQSMLDRVAREKPDVEIWSVGNLGDPEKPWTLWLAKGAGILKINPYSGEIMDHYDPHSTLDGVIVAVHRWWAAAPGETRRWIRHIVSAVTLFLIVQVVLGTAIWLMPRKRLRRLWPEFSQGPRIAILRLHNLLGVVTALFLIVISFTGMSLFWTKTTQATVEFLTGGKVEQVAPPVTAGLAPVSDVDAAIALGRSVYPDLALLSFRVLGGNASVSLRLGAGEGRAVHQVWVGDSPPRILAVDDAGDRNFTTRVWQARFGFHAGTFGGWPTRILWAVFSFLPVLFVLSGLWLWWARRGLGRRRMIANAPSEPGLAGQ